jgi:hypothetical protein
MRQAIAWGVAALILAAPMLAGATARADSALAMGGRSWGLCSDYDDPDEASACALRMCRNENRAAPDSCEIIFTCAKGGYGAFSTGPQSEFVGMACGHFTPDSARASALRQCAEGGADCQIDALWQDLKGADPALLPE